DRVGLIGVNRVALVALLACGSPPKQPEPVSNHVAEADQSCPTPIRGKVVDAATGEALAGVTIIGTGPMVTQPQAAISDEKGAFVLPFRPGITKLTVYYVDLTVVVVPTCASNTIKLVQP